MFLSINLSIHLALSLQFAAIPTFLQFMVRELIFMLTKVIVIVPFLFHLYLYASSGRYACAKPPLENGEIS